MDQRVLRWFEHTESGLAIRVDQRVLRWFGRTERMDEYRMARRVLMAEVMECWYGVHSGSVG